MLKMTIFAAAMLVVGFAVPASADTAVPASALQVAQAAAPATTTGRITGRGVRLRAEASTSSRILARLARGTSVTVLGRSGEFTQVRAGRRTGYVASQYVQ
jgi:uncharacterized protein YgiM (DUF1202 family)